MRKDRDVPQGTVHTVWIDSTCLKDNLLGDPARRRVDVYVPVGHDGSGLALLVDLVGFTAGGPAHTSWKNYGENLPERLDRLIGTGAMAAGRRRLPGLLHEAWRQPICRQCRDGTLGTLPHRRNAAASRGAIRLRRQGSARRLRQEFGRLRRDRPRDAPWWIGMVRGRLSFGRHGLRTALPRRLPEGPATPRRTRHVAGDLREKIRGGSQGKGRGLAHDDVPRPGRDLRSGPDTLSRDQAADRYAHLRDHRGPVGELAALRSSADGEGEAAPRCAFEFKILFVDCGDIDQYNLVYGARILHRMLDEAGIAHVYEEFHDNHSSIDYRMDRSLPLLVQALKG